MSENISMTRIIDLPDTSGVFEQNNLGIGSDMYIPINGHPNPYGIPPPNIGGIAPPQQTQPGPTQYKNTMYSANVQQQKPAPQYSQEQFNEMFTQQQRLPQRDIPMNISEHIQDEELAVFYRDLMESEAGHYTTFITYARKYGKGIDVEKRWREWIAYEASIIENYGKSETIHG